MYTRELTRSRGHLLYGVKGRTKDTIIMSLIYMVKSITNMVNRVIVGDVRDKDLGWILREDTEGMFYVLKDDRVGRELDKLYDYYMEPNLFSVNQLEQLWSGMMERKDGITNDDLLNSYDTGMYETFEESPLYKLLGAQGLEVLETLLAIYFDMDLQNYVHTSYIMYKFERVIYQISLIPSSYTKLNKAFSRLEGVNREDEFLLGLIQLFKGGYKGTATLRRYLTTHLEGYNQSEEVFGGIESNTKVLHNMPTQIGLNQMVYYTLLLEELLNTKL